MGMFDGPLFDFNGNGKLDFHELMAVADVLHKQMEDNEQYSSFNNHDYINDEKYDNVD